MAHKANVTLTCDIEYKNKIIFENKEVYIYADVDVSLDRYGDISDVSDWNTDDETYRCNRDNYLYAVILKEWTSSPDVENYNDDVLFEEFTLLVKSEDYEDIEIDPEMFEPDWDLMREGK